MTLYFHSRLIGPGLYLSIYSQRHSAAYSGLSIDTEPEKHKHCPEPLVAVTGFDQGYIECGFMDLPGLDVTSCSSMPTSL